MSPVLRLSSRRKISLPQPQEFLMRKTLLSLTIAGIALTGCGTTATERGTSGAGIGAAAGAVVGAVTGLSVVQGAVLGAVAGGATGALTKKDQVDLGEPVWKQNGAAPAQTAYSDQSPTSQQTVAGIQSALQRLGLYGGSIDGMFGPQTQAGIKAYQQQRGLVVDGIPSPQLLTYMNQNAG
jgi:Putative peptidoglycan binding domain/Glycine zipper